MPNLRDYGERGMDLPKISGSRAVRVAFTTQTPCRAGEMHENGVRLDERLSVDHENRHFAVAADLAKVGRSVAAVAREIDRVILVLEPQEAEGQFHFVRVT